MNRTIPPPTEANVLKAYKEADDKGKKLLVNLYGSEVFNPKPLMERRNTFENVCEEAGRDIGDFEVKLSMSHKEKADKFLERLMLLEVVFNQGKKVNRADTSQRKWSPYHNIILDASAPLGFRLAFDVCICDAAYAYLGARPEFIREEDAKHAGTQFIAEYEGFARNFQLYRNELLLTK